MTVLEVNDLSVRYDVGDDESVHAVDEVSFTVQRGETFGLVGESGCGKTTLGHSLLKLLDANGRVESGEIWFEGTLPRWADENGTPRQEIIDDDRYPVRADGKTNLAELDVEDMREIRWREISLIPQNAMNALNPVYRVGDQIVEAIMRHEPGTPEGEARERARDLLERVGIEPARAEDYAHEFSGGMKQRAVIAMAMACNPTMLIADEPTTALDVIIQDRVLEELDELQEEFDLSIIVISHDISVMAEICDSLGVMYGGKMMESGSKEAVLDTPSNPYTLGLKNSFPTITEDQDLVSIPGTAPTLIDPEPGCRFADRCPFEIEECRTAHPPSYDVAAAEDGLRQETDSTADIHRSACYRVDELDMLRREALQEETWLQQEQTATR